MFFSAVLGHFSVRVSVIRSVRVVIALYNVLTFSLLVSFARINFFFLVSVSFRCLCSLIIMFVDRVVAVAVVSCCFSPSSVHSFSFLLVFMFRSEIDLRSCEATKQLQRKPRKKMRLQGDSNP